MWHLLLIANSTCCPRGGVPCHLCALAHSFCTSDDSTAMAALKLERVLISDKTDPCCEEILRQGGISVDVKPKLPKDQLLQEIEVERRV